jgi:predicted enzyme related to lactoylglutathione lyase
MEKVTGIGGIFLKAEDPVLLQKWYQETLGLPAGSDGYTLFRWRDADVPERTGETAWSLFPKETDYFDPSPASCMINYRVENLERMLAQLREAGVTVVGEAAEDYGRFAWVLDPEGNKIELWEPTAPATG